MFETAELGRALSKEDFHQQESELRTRMLDVQHKLAKADFPVIILVNGVDGAGKGDTINLLNDEWMDPRNVITHTFDQPTEEESHRPAYWRYWMALPPAGRVAFFVGAWYTQPILERAYDRCSEAELDSAMVRVNAFEKTLVDNGALIIKLWLHVSKKQQRRRFKKLESDSATAWRVTKRDWQHAKLYNTFRAVSERAIRATSTGEAPWFIVDSANKRYRYVTVATHIIEQIQRRLDSQRERVEPAPQPPIENPETILDTLDLTLQLEQVDYKAQLRQLQARLNKLSRKARKKDVGVTLVFEGYDAGGKGGAIRRIIAALDARQYRVIRVAAPTDEEKAHHYLWRFWRHLPRLGRFTIYDRSWYGRVLVERVEGFATEAEWMRSYKEINDFEEQLVAHGIVLAKFWMHISQEEQLRRFQDRERVPWKRYKITDEDYRNREKANQYEAAANEMVERTSTAFAPWTLVEGEDKPYARIKVLSTVCDLLAKAVEK